MIIETILSRLLYLPPRCSYLRNDLKFLDCYNEIDDGNGGFIPIVHVKAEFPAHFTLLYSHANAEDLGYMVDFFVWLAKYLSVDVIGYDYPGYGVNLGETNETSVKKCACSTIDYIIDQLGIDPNRLILYGHSLGSAISVYLSVYIANSRKCGVAGVILQSCFMSIYRILFNLRFNALYDQYETINIIHSIRSPVTFIHGIQDPIVPISHAMQLFVLVPLEYRFRNLFVPLAGHNNIEYYCKPRSVFIDHLSNFIV